MNREAAAELIHKALSEVQEITKRYTDRPMGQITLANLENEVAVALARHLGSASPEVRARQIGTTGVELQYFDEEGVPWHLYPLLKKRLKL